MNRKLTVTIGNRNAFKRSRAASSFAAPAATTKRSLQLQSKGKLFKLNIRRQFGHCNAIMVGVAIQFVNSLLWFHISC